jgi:drug/metabolite transporter (DMT)-like permease
MTRTSKAAIAAAIIFWASAFVGIRAGLNSYSPEGLSLLRCLIASLILSIIYFNLPSRSKMSLADKLGLMFVGVIGIGIYNLTLNYGELVVPSGIASFITSQSPVITTIFAVLFLGERLTLQRICGFLVSFLGIAIIAYGEIGKFELTTGMMYMIGAMIAGSCFSIMQKPYLKRINAIEATTYIMWGGTLFLLMHFGKMQHDIMQSPWSSTLIVVYLGIFPSSLAYIAWSYVLSRLSISHAVSYLYVMPFIAAFMGWLMLGEVPAFISAAGAVIAIGGVWLVSQSYKAHVVPAPPPPLLEAV